MDRFKFVAVVWGREFVEGFLRLCLARPTRPGRACGVYGPPYGESFANRLSLLRTDVGDIVRSLKERNKKIVDFGAACGGTLITYLFFLK